MLMTVSIKIPLESTIVATSVVAALEVQENAETKVERKMEHIMSSQCVSKRQKL